MHDTIEITIAGMTCANCVRHVTEALRGVAGVQGVEVDLDAGLAKVVHDGARRDHLLEAVAAAGYDAD